MPRSLTRMNLAAATSGLQPLEPRTLLSGNPILTEFVASNQSTLDDGFGNSSDWIEIHNAGDMAVDLADYHLTDSASNLTKWTFTQPTVIEPGGYRVVFASGQDTVDPAGFDHTNFSLSAGGEYVALVDPNGVVLSSFGENGNDYPEQVGDIAYGLPGINLVDAEKIGRLLIPTDNSFGTSWTVVGFNDSGNGFGLATSAIGYEANPGSDGGFGGLIGTTLPVGTVGAYQRFAFSLNDPSEIAGLELLMRSDDGFIAYLNGVRVAELNAPASPVYDSVATGQPTDQEAVTRLAFSLDDHLDLLNVGSNVLAIHALNRGNFSSDMLSITELNASLTAGSAAYLQQPTPGSGNTPATQVGPQISVEDAAPTAVVPTNAPLTINATIEEFANPVNASTVTLHYRVGFGAEVSVAMAQLPDGRFTAQIPASAIQAGEMTRWYVTAEDTQGIMGRGPRFLDPVNSPQYFGVVGDDPSIDTDLKLIQWFIQDTAGSFTDAGARASIVVRGVFYDNIDVNAHGQSTRGPQFAKKSFDFDANSGNKFDLGDGVPKVSDFNLLTNYADQTKLRHTIANTAHEISGGAHLIAEPVTVYRNGEFYGLFDLVEEGDSEQLERLGLDPNNPLYKVNNPLESIFNDVSKESRKFEDFSDLAELVAGRALDGTAARIFDFDNLDLAAWINWIAVNNVIGNGDFGHKNQFVYRDTTGTGQWSAFPWDLDLSFGHTWNGNLGGNAYFDPALKTTQNVYFGFNDIVRRIMDDPVTGTAYRQRVVNLTHQLFGPEGSSAENSVIGSLITTWEQKIADEAAADEALWGRHPNFSQTPAQAADQLLDDYIEQRRNFILNNQLPSYTPQTGNPLVEFGVGSGGFDVEPVSGDLAEQYVTITNPTGAPVDLSGWTLSNGIDHTFPAGTVVAAGQTLYVVADVQAFLNRATGPTGGQQRFVQGNFDGQLSANGEFIQLRGADDGLVDVLVMPDSQGDLHLDQLRVTELHYNPPGSGDTTEFIELTNISPVHTLDLEDVSITQGPSSPYVFAAGTALLPGQSLVVVHDPAAFSAEYPGVSAAGVFSGSLSNGGETITLADPNGDQLLSFTYDDQADWPTSPDGDGPSLTLIDPETDVADLGTGSLWRASHLAGGTPGTLLDAIPGDYDADGLVAQSDLDLVLLNWGGSAPTGWLAYRPDGTIGQSQLDGVLLNWGDTAAASNVPAWSPPAVTASLFADAPPPAPQLTNEPDARASTAIGSLGPATDAQANPEQVDAARLRSETPETEEAGRPQQHSAWLNLLSSSQSRRLLSASNADHFAAESSDADDDAEDPLSDPFDVYVPVSPLSL